MGTGTWEFRSFYVLWVSLPHSEEVPIERPSSRGRPPRLLRWAKGMPQTSVGSWPRAWFRVCGVQAERARQEGWPQRQIPPPLSPLVYKTPCSRHTRFLPRRRKTEESKRVKPDRLLRAVHSTASHTELLHPLEWHLLQKDSWPCHRNTIGVGMFCTVPTILCIRNAVSKEH